MARSKEYVFRFPGTKDAFLQKLDSLCPGSGRTRYLGDYLIEIADNEIRFGIERAGHSGGNWYVSPLREVNGRLEFRGKIRYIGPEDDRNRLQKVLDKVFEVVMIILIWPIGVLVDAISLLLRKLRKLPLPLSQEQKLMELMHRLGCIQVQTVAEKT